jgi:hypothetical protein
MKTSGAAVLILALLVALCLAQAAPATAAARPQAEDEAMLTIAESSPSSRAMSNDEPAQTWEPDDLDADEPPDDHDGGYGEPSPNDEPVMDPPEVPVDEGMDPGAPPEDF